jgi:peroxiredoxin
VTRLPPLLLASLFVAALCAAYARAEDETADLRDGPQRLPAAERGVGGLVPDIAFTDVDGSAGRLRDFHDRKALVIAYTNVGCPVCKRYGPRLAQLEKDWRARGVAFLFVNPSPQDSPEQIAAVRAAYGLEGRYLHDSERELTRVLRPDTTGEVFVLDAARTLRYRGAVDDQYGVGYVRDEPSQRYLEDALESILQNRRPEVEATSAPGCVLELAEGPRGNGSVTWTGQIERILQRRCQDCHRAGENGPFSLTTYAEAKGNAGMIRWAVEERVMPPWFASPESLACRNDPSLSVEERTQILRWIEDACPQGKAEDAPLPRTFVAGWKIGTPDDVLEIPREVDVPTEGAIDYQYFTVATNYPEDRWVQGFEIRPTSPQVVHHVLVFAKYPKDHPRRREEPRVHGGVAGYFAAMVPGQGYTMWPEGTARFLPKGTRLRFQIHYTTNGTRAKDRTRLGLVFAKEKPTHEMQSVGIYNVGLRIPPGADHHPETASRVLHEAARIYSFTPHMHVRGAAFRYEAVFPDGTRKLLIDIPRYDFNWQLSYILAEPLDVPAGTRIHATGWYDNSAENPANPDPEKLVRWGEQTWEEMLIGYLDWHPVAAGK